MRRGLFFAFLVLVLLVGALRLFGSGGEPDIEPGSTLVLRLAGEYVEAPEPSLLGRLLGQPAQPFVGLLSQLALAERDDRLERVVLRIESLGIGWGKVQELRAAVARLREAGRHTVAYLELADFSPNRAYYLASAADEIWVVPGGVVPLVGLAAEYLYLGGLWEKLGIDFQVAKAGRYKSAVEFYAGTGMSDASREMADALLDSTEEQFVAGVAEGRGLRPEQVRALFDRGVIRTDELVAEGMIEGVRHLDELTDSYEGPIVEADDYARVEPATVGFDPVAQYALIYGSGVVQGGDGTSSPRGDPIFAAEAAVRALEEAAEADDIDAIILRLDSPGGSALASEIIWHAAIKAKESSGKPLIASFSDLAASGAYYVASAADGIVSQGATLTGSIGVFALRPIVHGALDKLGIGVESLTRGARADFALGSTPLSAGARELLQTSVLDTYELFLSRVAAGRSLERDAVDSVGQGRVWTGQQALEHGLVDELGGLREAIALAKKAQGLGEDEDVVLVPYPPPKPFAQQIAELVDARAAGALLELRLTLPEPLATLEHWLGELPSGAPLLIPPALVEIR